MDERGCSCSRTEKNKPWLVMWKWNPLTLKVHSYSKMLYSSFSSSFIDDADSQTKKNVTQRKIISLRCHGCLLMFIYICIYIHISKICIHSVSFNIDTCQFKTWSLSQVINKVINNNEAHTQKQGQNMEQVHDLRNDQWPSLILCSEVTCSSFLLINCTPRNNDIKGVVRKRGLYKTYKYNICGSTYLHLSNSVGCCSWALTGNI